jgi:hypothetical protein
MNVNCCPYCHVVLVLKALDIGVAVLQCPACCYVVLVPLRPVPIVSNTILPGLSVR